MARSIENTILILTILLTLSVRAATAQIKGMVVDATDNSPVAGATISDFYGRVLAKADIDGCFLLNQSIPKRLLVTSIGYKPQEYIVVNDGNNEIFILMEPEDMQLDEVIVTKKHEKYKRKNNPAVELMRKVIYAKRNNNIKNKEYYRYIQYQKISAGFNDLKQEDLQRGMFKNRPWLNNHIEISQYNNKLTMPLMVEETISEKYYRKNPLFEKNIIKGHQITGVSNLFQTGEIINSLLKDIFMDIDIYDDNIRFLQHSFTSPTAREAIAFYHFYITDTLYVNQDSCYQVDFIPANQQDFGFNGKLYVLADGSYQVRRCEMSFPKNSEVNWIKKMKCIQDFAQLKTGEWVLCNDDMIAEIEVMRNAAKAIVVRNTRKSDFSFDAIPDSLINGNRTEKKNIMAECQTKDYWEKYRAGNMTKGERAVDTLVTEMKQMRGFNYLMMGMKALFEDFLETGNSQSPSKFDIGPIFSMGSYNFYDGFRMRFGGQTTASFNPHFFVKGYYAYGFKSHENYFDTQLIYSLNTHKYQPFEFPKRTVTIEAMRDVALPSDKFQETDKDNLFSSLKISDMDKMFLYNRIAVRFEFEFLSKIKLFSEVKTEKVTPIGNIDFKPLSYTSPLDNIKYTEATIGFRYAPNETYLTTKQQRWTINFSSPIIRLQHTKGFKGLLGGHYNYNYTEFEVSKPFWLPMNWGCIESRLLLGIQWNQVPFPLLIMPVTNVSFIKSSNSFDLINNMEFLNDRILSWELNWDLSGKLFNRIPLLKKLKCREFLGVKCLWGALSEKNNPYVEINSKSNIIMSFPEGSYIMDSHVPYWELSIGVHNILNILHVEYIRRLNYLDLPTANKQAVKFALEFKF